MEDRKGRGKKEGGRRKVSGGSGGSGRRRRRSGVLNVRHMSKFPFLVSAPRHIYGSYSSIGGDHLTPPDRSTPLVEQTVSKDDANR